VKRSQVILTGAALAVGALFIAAQWLRSGPSATVVRPQPTIEIHGDSAGWTAIAGKASPESVPSPIVTGSGLAIAAELNAPGQDATHDVQTLHAMLRLYLRALHHRQGPPIGDDIDLARVLTGHNPMHFVIMASDHPALAKDGHIRDRWGTPYFIHALGYGIFEVRSAGPDQKMFTADDIVDGGAQQQHTEIPDDFAAQ